MTIDDTPTGDAARDDDGRRLVRELRAQTRVALAGVGLRLARSLAARFGAPDGRGVDFSGLGRASQDELARALAFPQHYARQVAEGTTPADAAFAPAHPLARLRALALPARQSAMLADLLLLACLPEAHEGFATLCRLLHPDGAARPDLGFGNA